MHRLQDTHDEEGERTRGEDRAEYFVTSEVLNERPYSQQFPAIRLIEREAGVEERVLRPLSAKMLPETELERRG